MGSYVFRWPYPANDVHVTGTFDDWSKSEQLEKVGNVWEKEVYLSSADEKIYYKFVVDDEWIVDDHAPKEEDGHNNINNVLLPQDIKRRELTSSAPGAFPETPAVEQEFNVAPLPATEGTGNPVQIAPGEKVPDSKTVTSNTIASTATTSKDDYDKIGQETDPSFSVAPLPATGGTLNPIALAPGEKVPDSKDVTSNTIDSAVTTSKDDYENIGRDTPQEFSVNPIPASTGISNPIALGPGEKIPPTSEFNTNKLDAAVTTSKGDYDKVGTDSEQIFSVQPIPPSSGISNPINLPPGETIPPTGEFNTNTVDSAVTTSKEDYEKAGDSTFPGAVLGTAAAGAGIGGAAAAVSALSKSEGKKNIIPESSLPMNPSQTDTLDAGPFISSAAPGSTTAQLAANVPLEQNRDVNPFISSAAPTSTTAALAANVPIEQRSEISPFVSSAAPGSTTGDLAAKVPVRKPEVSPLISSTGPESTTTGLAAQVPVEKQDGVPGHGQVSSDTIKEKSAVEEELLSKVRPTDATGQPASAATQQSSYHGLATSVPKPVEQSMLKANAPPEAAADASIVAEKGAFEKELLAKIPSTDEAGEPAPTIAAATSATAPATTTTDTTGLTGGKIANETIADTDTSTATRGQAAGEIAAGGAVGTAAGAGLAAASARHANPDIEPPRIADAQKPHITTEAAPASIKAETPAVTAEQSATIDHSLVDEPAVRMMTQNETGNAGAQTESAVTNGSAGAAALASGVPSITNTGTAAPAESKAVQQTTTKPPSAPSTPAKKTTAETSAASSPASTTPGDAKKKRRHRLSAIIKDLFHKKD